MIEYQKERMMTVEITIQKTLVERYQMMVPGYGEVNITIDSGGRFGVTGECGTYHYQWLGFGEDFKAFLMQNGTNADYMMDKMAERVVNRQKTKQQWVKCVKENRYEYDLTTKETRELLVDIRGYITASDNGEEMLRSLYDHPVVKERFEEPWFMFECVYEYPQKVHTFFGPVMEAFVAKLKEEKTSST